MWRRALVGTKKRSWVWYSVHIILHASIVATAAGSKLIIHSTLNSDGIVHYADNTFEQWLFYGATSTSYFMFSLGSDPQGSSRCVAGQEAPHQNPLDPLNRYVVTALDLW